MLKRALASLSTVVFAFLVLSVSILRSARINYAFSGDAKNAGPAQVVLGDKTKIDYELPYPGNILPDNSLWVFKAGRDNIWLGLTTNASRKSELNLLFANKRLSSAKILFERNKPEIAFSTLSKAEKYLESASRGVKDLGFAEDIAKASLKHKEVIDEIMTIAPEDARPKVAELARYPESAYKTARDFLRSKGKDAPESPFDWD
ncbi:hypothetical protein HY502_01120 [Candidatus Woesebacteria bacterium]|nr:hypothetical protein [Candidatus Woesebacteria bacterium]